MPPSAKEADTGMPSQLSMLGRGLAGIPRQPVRAIRGLPRALPHLDQNPMLRHMPGIGTLSGLSRRAFRARPRTKDGGLLEGRTLHAPRTMLNRSIPRTAAWRSRASRSRR